MTAKMWMYKDGITGVYYFCSTKQEALQNVADIRHTCENSYDEAGATMAADTQVFHGMRECRQELEISDYSIRKVYNTIMSQAYPMTGLCYQKHGYHEADKNDHTECWYGVLSYHDLAVYDGFYKEV